ncbi:tetratricopeptide repeat protein [Aureispira anguillae]|uniref:Tetratricopeptide repeat-like domain-containing protein n=1 Tax=Aureispira anguillae TaxID=2864201 RepID=A0A915YFC5_9BACT|nr:hypothetical protein [Aureispira anguillae]BDS12110.1 hypothetical protein AsAng_0028250 [Aureispira anguillae]
MANEQYTEIQDLSADELKAKANNVFEENKNLVTGVGAVLVVLILGIYWYSQMYKKPREAEGQIELYKANIELERDSFKLALTGREVIGQANNFIGYVGIIDQYSGTDASNLAHYYAGVASLKIGKPDLALDYLSNFSGEELLQTQAYTMMGDAASELEDIDGAVNYYNKAAAATDNLSLALYAKYKAGKLMEYKGKSAEAKKYFQDILDTDKQIGESLGADKDLIRLK